MNEGFLAVSLIAALSMALGPVACSTGDGHSKRGRPHRHRQPTMTAQPEAEADGSACGCAGTDPVEAAVCKYIESRTELGTITISDHANLNGLAATQYQDYG